MTFLERAMAMGSLAPAFANSLLLGIVVATIGVPTIGVLAWIIYRSRMPGRGAMEFLIMVPQAVPRLVFGLGLLWAWINIPIPIYGTLWLLGIAYFTVFIVGAFGPFFYTVQQFLYVFIPLHTFRAFIIKNFLYYIRLFAHMRSYFISILSFQHAGKTFYHRYKLFNSL